MGFNYIKDIIRSGLGEEATLIKRNTELNEWGDTVGEKTEEYKFLTVVDSLERAENEVVEGDYIEGDIRFYVSEDTDVVFNTVDAIRYKGQRYNIDSIRTVTLGTMAKHKEIIAQIV